MDPLIDFDTQDQLLAQQAARIKALRAIGATTPEAPAMSPGWTSAVTGTHIGGQTLRTPTMALLNPLLGTVGAELGQDKLNTDTQALNAAKQSDFADILKTMPQAKKVPLGPDEPIGSFTGDPSLAIAQMTDPVERERAQQAWANQQQGNMRTVQPTQSEMLAQVARMEKNPLARALATKTLDETLFTRPDKLEERTYQSGEKAKDRGSVLTAAIAKQRFDAQEAAAKRAQSQTNAEIMAGARRASTDQETFTLIPGQLSSNGLPVERGSKSGTTREVQPPAGTNFVAPEKPVKELSDKAKQEQSDLLTGSRTYASAFSNYKDAYSGSFGGAKLASKLGQYTPFGEETSSFWAPINKQTAKSNKETYGANFTATEQTRADAYNPSEYKSREQNLVGLGQMAIDQGLAHLRSNYLHNNPGSYVDNDGAVVLKDGRVINETRSRLITKEEVQAQKLDPIPTYRDIAAANPKAGGATSARAAAPADAPASNERPLSIVRSKAERDALPPDTPYIDGQGNRARTPK